MGFNLGPMDYMNLPYLPLMFVTAKQVRQEWPSLWDVELTDSDRRILKQLVIFWLLPVIVLCHELGHVAAIRLFGGQVAEFHYTFIWGYVVPSGHFTPDQIVWLYFSGNLLQIVLGFLALALAFVFRSPPVVALCVYMYFFTVAGTAVFYALLSVTDMYGDWVSIYKSHAQPLVTEIACFHAAVLGVLFYCLYSRRAKLWFTYKTQPGWEEEHRQLLEAAEQNPTAENWLNLGWCYFSAGLVEEAERCIKEINRRAPPMLPTLMLEAAIAERRNNFDKALIAYDGAIALAPNIADPHFFKASLLNHTRRFSDAESELVATYNLEWINPDLQHAAIEELERSRRGRSESQ